MPVWSMALLRPVSWTAQEAEQQAPDRSVPPRRGGSRAASLRNRGEQGDDGAAFALGLEPGKWHLVARHRLLRIGEIGVQRRGIPCQVARPHGRRKIVSGHGSSLLAHDIGERWSDAVLACIKRMACPALLEHLTARGSITCHRGLGSGRRGGLPCGWRRRRMIVRHGRSRLGELRRLLSCLSRRYCGSSRRIGGRPRGRLLPGSGRSRGLGLRAGALLAVSLHIWFGALLCPGGRCCGRRLWRVILFDRGNDRNGLRWFGIGLKQCGNPDHACDCRKADDQN